MGVLSLGEGGRGRRTRLSRSRRPDPRPPPWSVALDLHACRLFSPSCHPSWFRRPTRIVTVHPPTHPSIHPSFPTLIMSHTIPIACIHFPLPSGTRTSHVSPTSHILYPPPFHILVHTSPYHALQVFVNRRPGPQQQQFSNGICIFGTRTPHSLVPLSTCIQVYITTTSLGELRRPNVIMRLSPYCTILTGPGAAPRLST